MRQGSPARSCQGFCLRRRICGIYRQAGSSAEVSRGCKKPPEHPHCEPNSLLTTLCTQPSAPEGFPVARGRGADVEGSRGSTAWCWLGIFEEGAQLWDGRNRPWVVLVLGAAAWHVGGSSPAVPRMPPLLQRTFPAASTKMKLPGKFFPVSRRPGSGAGSRGGTSCGRTVSPQRLHGVLGVLPRCGWR